MVFPESPRDSPPFPLSSSASFSLSASTSLQTHLSSSNSEQRLRSFPSATGDLEKQTDPEPDDSDDEADEGDNTSQSAAKQRFFCLVKAFVSFSALFFPISVYRDSGAFSPRPSVRPLGEDYQSDNLGSLWESELFLSKITTLDLRPERFRYSAFDGFYNSHDLTACAWSNLADFDASLAWLHGWPGSISFILSVDRPRDLDVAQSLLQRLIETPSNGTLQNQRISYLIYLKGSAGEQPNAYLNLARLVSQTDRVVLFPKLVTELPPTAIYSDFYNSTRNAPAVLTSSRESSAFPFIPFSPLMVHRDDATWCDERFDFLGSPSVPWAECLWQFWVTKHGGVQTIVSKHPWKTAQNVNQTMVAFEERLRDHFRDEICSLVTRSTLALVHSLDDRGVPSSQQQQQPVPEKYAAQRRWLKKHCRQFKVKGL